MAEILIVDNDASICNVIAVALRSHGHSCTSVSNAQEARQKLRRQSFDLVTLDIQMQGESGLSLLGHIKEKYPDVSVVMVSGISEEETALEALDLGAYGYVAKPFDSNEIVINVANALRRRELEINQKAYRQDLERTVREKTSALGESEARLRGLLDAVPDPVVAYDSEGRATYVNDAFKKTFGWSRGEVIGHRIDFVPSEEKTKTRDAWDRLFRGREGTFESRRLTKDGRVLDVHIRGSVIRDANGQVIESVVILQDVTEEKQVEQQSEQQFKFMETLINAAPSPIFYKDVEGRYRGCNQAFLDYLGRTRDEVVDKTVFDLWPPELAEKYHVMDSALMQQSGTQVYEAQVQYPDGSRHDVIFHKATFHDPDGSVAGLIGVISDITERKQAEARIQAERERFRTLTDQSPLGVSLIRPDGTYAYVNPAFTRIFGYALDDVPNGRTWYRLAYPDSEQRRAEIADWKRDILGRTTGAVMSKTSTVRCKDGSDKVVHFWVVGLEAGDHLVLFEDITERTRAEQALRESEERYRDILMNIEESYYEVDLKGNLTFFNDSLVRLYGYDRDELMGLNYRVYIKGNEAEKVFQTFNRVHTTGQPARGFGWEITTKDGTKRFVEASVTQIKDANGRGIGFRGIGRDITERRAAEEALRESEDRYRTLVEALPTGFIRANEKTEFIYFNDRLAEMLGYAPEELNGKRTLDFLDDANRQVLLHQVELRKEGATKPYELAWTKKDGQKVFTMMYPNPVFDREGHYQGSFALIADITDRKILESQLLQSQKLESIGQLAAGIAHEINTPTQYVTDNTRFMQEAFDDIRVVLNKYADVCRKIKDGASLADLQSELAAALERAELDYLIEEIPRAVSQSLEGLGRIADIVRSMKEFAHPGPDTKAPLDLNQAILSTITVARNEWKYVADLETDLDSDLPPVPCVAGEINQVILNVIVNAAQAIAEEADRSSGEKGRILVSTRAKGDWAEIRITDTGPGIPPNIRDRVFDPFFTTKDPGKGTGQGLAIAYRVITDKHGGTISLTSEENQGTTFVIRLPLTPSSLE